MAATATLGFGERFGRFTDRRFKYLMIWPAVLVLLLIGIFPLVYTLVVSFQHITMMAEDTSFSGLVNYARLLRDARFWSALGHTAIFTVVALPIELALGMAMALLFLDRMPGRQVFIALLVLPTVISPIVAGATWRL
ncbi:MAG: carbohydrate ABC transporter permease, partial [Geminicoccaceae bacterium]